MTQILQIIANKNSANQLNQCYLRAIHLKSDYQPNQCFTAKALLASASYTLNALPLFIREYFSTYLWLFAKIQQQPDFNISCF